MMPPITRKNAVLCPGFFCKRVQSLQCTSQVFCLFTISKRVVYRRTSARLLSRDHLPQEVCGRCVIFTPFCHPPPHLVYIKRHHHLSNSSTCPQYLEACPQDSHSRRMRRRIVRNPSTSIPQWRSIRSVTGTQRFRHSPRIHSVWHRMSGMCLHLSPRSGRSRSHVYHNLVDLVYVCQRCVLGMLTFMCIRSGLARTHVHQNLVFV